MTPQESYIKNIEKSIELENSNIVKERQMFNEGQILLQKENAVIKLEISLISNVCDRLKKIVDILMSLEQDKRLSKVIKVPGDLCFFQDIDVMLNDIKSKINELYNESSNSREKNHFTSLDSRRENLKVLSNSLIDIKRFQSESEKQSKSVSFQDMIENLKTSLKATDDDDLKDDIQKYINELVKDNFEHLKTFKLNKGA